MKETTQTPPPVYTEIPPTTDLNYWQVKSTRDKAKVFTPIDKELHKALLTEARSKRPIRVEFPQQKRHGTNFRRY